ncbi:phage regulatory CII family protein [Luteimonas qiangzhengi]
MTDAAYATVHDYPGGAGSLAPRIGTTQAVLNSKVNPNTTTHHLTLAEAVKLMVLTGDKRMLHAIAMESGDVVVEGAAALPACDMAVLEAMTGVFARAGQVGANVHTALADGRVTRKELAAIERQAYALQQKAVALVHKLAALQVQEPGRG